MYPVYIAYLKQYTCKYILILFYFLFVFPFIGLAIRLENTEKEIKTMMDDALRDTSSLTLQSKHLRKRLLLCVEFNQDIVNKEAPVYNEVDSMYKYVCMYVCIKALLWWEVLKLGCFPRCVDVCMYVCMYVCIKRIVFDGVHV